LPAKLHLVKPLLFFLVHAIGYIVSH